ncbi:MAG: hypothetical protein ACFFDN_07590 [Candidatus Hodarchaeota archaeon]
MQIDFWVILLIFGAIFILVGLGGIVRINFRNNKIVVITKLEKLWPKIFCLIIGIVLVIFAICMEVNKSSSKQANISDIINDLNLSITNPEEGDIFQVKTPFKVEGKYTGELPSNYRLWVLKKDAYNFFLNGSETVIKPNEKTWYQENVTIATSGEWKIIIYLATEAGSDTLRKLINEGYWSGIPTLPNGIHAINQINVNIQ